MLWWPSPGAPGDQVDCWKSADQKHRWLATALLDLEPRLRKVCGPKQLARLRSALQTHLKDRLERVDLIPWCRSQFQLRTAMTRRLRQARRHRYQPVLLLALACPQAHGRVLPSPLEAGARGVIARWPQGTMEHKLFIQSRL